ncbi:MAG: PAS domain-containing sensor histidine kinase, partial [Planctomycetaceae bacterium]|nr:PAS domain-containing sensor histidine kinase [Planctomycetaceae bacterium]
VIVQDNGHGIDDEARERLFQPYVTTKSTGTGLGLFVCHNILENSGGKIELVESTRAGTVFCVTLPLGVATAT